MNIKKSPGTKNILWQAIANPPDQNTWLSWNNQLGDLLRSEQRWDDAISTYESILEHNAAYWQAYIGLGWANYDRNDGLQAAINEFKKAIMIPNSREDSHSAIGFVLLRDGRYADADNWFVQALVINPDCRWFYAVQRDIATEVGDLYLALTILHYYAFLTLNICTNRLLVSISKQTTPKCYWRYRTGIGFNETA